jgi:hypothetical protein
MRFKILLIMHYLIREILVETVLDVHIKGVSFKKVNRSRCCNDTSFTKRVRGEILVLICTRKTICSLHDHGRKDDWVNF